MLLLIDSHSSLLELALSINGEIIDSYTATEAFEHNRAITLASGELLKRNNYSWRDLSGVGIISGPGSYTGLRVGLSTAKGFCFALDIPLLAVNMLTVMTNAFIQDYGNLGEEVLLLPVIDARRMEVFTQKFNGIGKALEAQTTFVYTHELFEALHADYITIYLFGDGAEKVKNLYHNLPIWLKIVGVKGRLSLACQLLNSAFMEGNFQDLAYFEPQYGKPYFIKNVN